MPRGKPSWTPAQDAVLRAMHKHHRTSEIASKLDCSRNAVIGRLNRLGLGGRVDRQERGRRISVANKTSEARRLHWNKMRAAYEQKQHIARDLPSKGHKWSAIGAILGVSEHRAWQFGNRDLSPSQA